MSSRMMRRKMRGRPRGGGGLGDGRQWKRIVRWRKMCRRKWYRRKGRRRRVGWKEKSRSRTVMRKRRCLSRS